MTLTQLKKELGITNQQVIDALSDRYPKLSKVAVSMASNEEDYGICLTPEAERILRKAYGRRWWQR